VRGWRFNGPSPATHHHGRSASQITPPGRGAKAFSCTAGGGKGRHRQQFHLGILRLDDGKCVPQPKSTSGRPPLSQGFTRDLPGQIRWSHLEKDPSHFLNIRFFDSLGRLSVGTGALVADQTALDREARLFVHADCRCILLHDLQGELPVAALPTSSEDLFQQPPADPSVAELRGKANDCLTPRAASSAPSKSRDSRPQRRQCATSRDSCGPTSGRRTAQRAVLPLRPGRRGGRSSSARAVTANTRPSAACTCRVPSSRATNATRRRSSGPNSCRRSKPRSSTHVPLPPAAAWTRRTWAMTSAFSLVGAPA
jgi:hypothetical protein